MGDEKAILDDEQAIPDEQLGDATSSAGAAEAEATELCCDFCGELVPRVRRIALDGEYDRLQRPHHVQYACEACSAEKERERLASG
jgi:hypothetical protein